MQNCGTSFIIIIINVFFFQFVQPVLAIQDSGDDWWWSQYEMGLKLLEESNYPGAQEAFNAILARDKKIAEAYYGLGLVESGKDAKSTEAIKHFDKAIRYKKNFARAYYQAALVLANSKKFIEAKKYLKSAVRRDPDFVEAWQALGDAEEKIGDSGEMIKAYAKAVNIDPKNQAAYSKLISAAITFHREDKIISVLEDLCSKHPDESNLPLDLAYMYYAAGKSEKSQETLSDIPADAASCRYFLLQARLNFDAEKDKVGLAYYWSAVNSIKTGADASAFFRDLSYIMRNDEYADLKETPISDVWRFYYRFWRSRDPNLATDINERIPEHYRRVTNARKWYRRHWRRGNDRRYLLEHPLREFMQAKIGDELLGPYLSQALPENIDLDDLGLIYVRHGEPDDIATHVDPQDEALPQNLSWRYKATYLRPELIFHFCKWSGNRGWILFTLPATFTGRSDFGGEYARLDPEQPTYQDFTRADFTRIYDLIEKDNVENARIGVLTETSDYGYEDFEMLDFPYQFVTFRGAQGKTLIEFYYGISGKNTELKMDSDGSKLMLEQFFAFHDEKWNEVGRIKKDRRILVGLSKSEWAERSLVDVQRFNIGAGAYNFEVRLRDKMSDRLGVYKGGCTIPDYWPESLSMSDILLSGEIKPAGANDQFVKEGMAYFPHMFSDFKINEKVGIYFEIYNLSKDSDGKTNFRLTCTLQPRTGNTTATGKVIGFFKSLFDKGKEVVNTSYDYQGQATNEKIYLNFELNNQRAGNFELAVTIDDLNANSSARGKVGIAIR